MRDVAVYVLGCDEGRVVALLAGVLGPLGTEQEEADSFRLYGGSDSTVLVRKDEDGVLDVSVYGNVPWPSSPALGRFLVAGVACVVRCDPGAEAPGVSPYSSAFLEMDPEGERLVDWE